MKIHSTLVSTAVLLSALAVNRPACTGAGDAQRGGGPAKSAGEPDPVRAHDGRDQLLLRWRPVCGVDPQPHLPVGLDRNSQLVPGRERDGLGEDRRRLRRKGRRQRSPTSAKLEVTKADANSPAGLLNEGYWGIAVRPEHPVQRVRSYAKSDSDGALPVKVALVADQSGQVLAKRLGHGDRDRLEGVQVRDAVRQVPPRPPRTISN